MGSRLIIGIPKSHQNEFVRGELVIVKKARITDDNGNENMKEVK